MPRQNRVTPFNTLLATPARGTLMGNRGILHDNQGRIVRPHAHRTWIACRLEFRGRHRPVMTPGRYTELFFLDEATALAAGHRPCAECRRVDYLRFRAALAAALGLDPASLRAPDMDRRLHAERLVGRGWAARKHTYEEACGELPEGTLFHLPGDEILALLKWQGRARPWTPEGYRAPRTVADTQPVRVLTPRPVVLALAAGYMPGVHPTAESGDGAPSQGKPLR